MSMLNTSNPEYRQSLPIIAEIRSEIKRRIGKLTPTKHYTENRAHGGMTKYYGISQLTYPQATAIANIIENINKKYPTWKADAHFKSWPGQLVIHVNKRKHVNALVNNLDKSNYLAILV